MTATLFPFEHNAMGVALSLEGIFGISASGYILLSLLNGSPCRRDPVDSALRISLALGDLAIGLMCPVFAIASFSHEWPYGPSGCQTYGFVATFFGLVNIWSLTALVNYRYQTSKPDAKPDDLSGRYFLLLAVIWFGAFFWAVTPLPAIGWGRYTLEPFGTSCLLDFGDRDPSYFVYLFGFAVTGLGLPIALLITRGLETKGVPEEAVSACWRAVLLLCCYWGVYGMVAVACALGGHTQAISTRLFALAPVLAKLCPIVNPLAFGETAPSSGKKPTVVAPAATKKPEEKKQ